MKKLFVSDQVNTGRQFEVDLSRGFTAIVLIICHVGLYLGNGEDIVLYTISDIIGSEFGAPIFMAMMGISIVYSRHQEPKALRNRGVKLFLAGYALSTFRSLLPLFLLGNIDEWTSLPAFFVVDIMQFAGLTFLFLSLLKKLKASASTILLVSLVMVGLDQILMFSLPPIVTNEVAGYFINLFVPVSEWSCFPFFTWFFFPAFGLFFGHWLSLCSNKDKLYKILLPVGLAGVLYVYSQFYLLYPDYPSYYWGNNFYYMGIKNVLLTSLFICFALSFWFFIGKFLPNALRRFLTYLSANLNLFYWISWIIISALIHAKAITGWNPDTPTIVVLMVVILLLCAAATKVCLIVRGSIKRN